MKYLLTAALAASLAAAAFTAQADAPPDVHAHNARPGPARGAPPFGGGHAPAPGGARGSQIGHGPLTPQANRGVPSPGPGGPRGGGPRPGASFGGHGFHSHGLRPSDRGRAYYSSHAFARGYVAERRFHYFGGGYPEGWYARTWIYGDFLPVGWFAPDFYLDYGYYALPTPPIGCEWVREGPDAVLVDIWTGEVLSVYSGVFY